MNNKRRRDVTTVYVCTMDNAMQKYDDNDNDNDIRKAMWDLDLAGAPAIGTVFMNSIQSSHSLAVE